MIYFLTYESLPGYVKIGYSENEESLDNRINQYATYNPTPVVVLKTMEGTLADETALHNVFSAYRAQNEWFFLTDAIKTYINSGSISSDVASGKIKHFYQKRPGNMIYFHRRIPPELQRFSKGDTRWFIPVSRDHAIALEGIRRHTEQTDRWIEKHRELLRKHFK